MGAITLTTRARNTPGRRAQTLPVEPESLKKLLEVNGELEELLAMRRDSLLLPREQNIIVDHVQWVWSIADQYEISRRPEILGKILLPKVRKLFKNLLGSMLSNGTDAAGRGRGGRNSKDPLDVIRVNSQEFEPPGKGYANLPHPRP